MLIAHVLVHTLICAYVYASILPILFRIMVIEYFILGKNSKISWSFLFLQMPLFSLFRQIPIGQAPKDQLYPQFIPFYQFSVLVEQLYGQLMRFNNEGDRNARNDNYIIIRSCIQRSLIYVMGEIYLFS